MIPDGSELQEIRRGVRELCAGLPDACWRDLDARREYPEAFVRAMTEAGYLAALIPEEYGGMALDLTAACAILEEANRSGDANANPAHAQMYVLGTLLRHGSEDSKGAYLPKIAAGDIRRYRARDSAHPRGRGAHGGHPARARLRLDRDLDPEAGRRHVAPPLAPRRPSKA